jgi:hypothetical protein
MLFTTHVAGEIVRSHVDIHSLIDSAWAEWDRARAHPEDSAHVPQSVAPVATMSRSRSAGAGAPQAQAMTSSARSAVVEWNAGHAHRQLVAGVMIVGTLFSSGCGAFRHRDREVEYNEYALHSVVTVAKEKTESVEVREVGVRVAAVAVTGAELKVSLERAMECRTATFSQNVLEHRQTVKDETGLVALLGAASAFTLVVSASEPRNPDGNPSEGAVAGLVLGGIGSLLSLAMLVIEVGEFNKVGVYNREAVSVFVDATEWARCDGKPYSGIVSVFMTAAGSRSGSVAPIFGQGTANASGEISFATVSFPAEYWTDPVWTVSAEGATVKIDKHNALADKLQVQGDVVAALAARQAKDAADDAARKAKEAADAEARRQEAEAEAQGLRLEEHRKAMLRSEYFRRQGRSCGSLYVGRPVTVLEDFDDVDSFLSANWTVWSRYTTPSADYYLKAWPGVITGIGAREVSVKRLGEIYYGDIVRVPCGFVE